MKIDQEREGEQIDRALLKNVLDIFVEIGMGQMDHYENDFETAMLKDTSAIILERLQTGSWKILVLIICSRCGFLFMLTVTFTLLSGLYLIF